MHKNILSHDFLKCPTSGEISLHSPAFLLLWLSEQLLFVASRYFFTGPIKHSAVDSF